MFNIEREVIDIVLIYGLIRDNGFMDKKQNLITSPILISLLIALAISILFTLIYGPYGLESSDTAYLRGFGYELIQGKRIKEELHFLFPIPLFFTSLLYLPMLPGTVLAERFFHFLFIGLTGFFSLHFLSSKKEISDKSILFFLPTILVLNISNFPVGLNYTITATMVGSAALFFYKREKFILSGFLLTMSYFSKTSFLLYIFLFTFFSFFERRDSTVKIISGVVLGFVLFKLIELSPIYGENTRFIKIIQQINSFFCII